MGGSSSSQSTTDGEIKNSSNKQNNYGLINLASENLDSSNWNFLEIFTFALVWIGCLYFLRLWCIRRRQKKLQSLRDALQSVQVVDVQPHAANVPVLQNPLPVSAPVPPELPVYPGLNVKSPAELVGGRIMSQYS